MASTRKNSQRFSSLDTVWWHLDRPTNLSTINGVITFDNPVDYKRLEATIQNRLLLYKRFRQRVYEPAYSLGLPRWENDPNFNLKDHLERRKFSEPVNPEMLQKLVSGLISMPLDRSKPLWHFVLVENYEKGSALIVRMHHCLADGLALVQILLSVVDDEPEAPWPESIEDFQPELSPMARMLRPGVKAAMTLADALRRGEKLVQYGRNALSEHSVLHNTIEFSKKSFMSLGKLLLLSPEPKTVFRGECGIPKRAVWSDPIPLNEIKEIGRDYDATINDVLLSAITGALHSYIEEYGDSVEGLNIRAIVPVDLRRPETLHQMGNLFGLVFLSLPVGIKNPLDRQVVLKQRMDTIKDTPEALVALRLLSAIGLTPQKMEKALIDIFSSKATVAVTNVPGPRRPLYLGRSRINGLMFWVPTPANLSLGISIISYSGQVLIGVMADSGIIPDPEKIVSLFHDELTYMKEWEQSTQEQRSGPKSKSEEIGDHVHGGSPQDTISQVIPDRCLAQTKTGEQCKNRSLLDSDYCHVHQKKDTQ